MSRENTNSDHPFFQEAARAGQPRHFHLLWDEDLDAMAGIFQAIRDRRAEVVRSWYRLYALHFGDARTMSEADFFQVFEPALMRNKSALLEKDMDRYAQDVRSLGETLAERGVPLQEIIASLQLFEQAATEVFPPESAHQVEIYTKFDQLSHIRIILLVDAYFRVWSATQGARMRGLEREAQRLPREQRRSFYGIVAISSPMRALFERIESASKTNGTALVVGESGTGKELVARALHEAGPRRDGPFIAFNCAAIPRDLIESELFGYRKGAFSGANTEYSGLFRAAERGTLFLDEITEMSQETQTKLLRAIQEHSVRPVGAAREVPVDVRLVASTNRDPEAAVGSQVLRQDLYYRLQAHVLRLPPLRERLEDVPVLIEHFIALFNQQLGRGEHTQGIGERALAAMCRYQWPGNVRELSNAVESAMTFGKSRLIELEDLPPAIGGSQPAGGLTSKSVSPPSADQLSIEEPATGTFAEAERSLIRRALEACEWNKVHAAQMLRISRKKLYAKISKYHLEPAQ